MNTLSAEYVLGLDKYQAETVFLSIVGALAMEGEEEWDLENQANRIMDNCKLYPEYFPQLNK